MKTVDFTQHLLNVQSELFRFAFKLTADREEANNLLQETSLKALDNEEKFTPDTNFKGPFSGRGCAARAPRRTGSQHLLIRFPIVSDNRV